MRANGWSWWGHCRRGQGTRLFQRRGGPLPCRRGVEPSRHNASMADTGAPRYIQAKTETVCLESLGEVQRHLKAAHENCFDWFWAMSALKLALQTFIVAGFGTSPRLKAIGQKKAEEFMQWLRGDGEYPNERMLPLPDLYEEAKRHPKWNLGDAPDESVRFLIGARNQFEHFLPGTWLVEKAGLPEIVIDVVSVLQLLGWVTRETPWSDQDLERQCRDALLGIRSEVERHRQI